MAVEITDDTMTATVHGKTVTTAEHPRPSVNHEAPVTSAIRRDRGFRMPAYATRIVHLGGDAGRAGARAAAEVLLLALLEPVPGAAFQVAMPVDPRAAPLHGPWVPQAPCLRRGLPARHRAGSRRVPASRRLLGAARRAVSG
ncbi:hypothetical protein [Actinomadura roseirufa]|uniref:hypothetical protein n=1 Tax=Actinomadura roseirufa TaxID=2094049 RepID=UPI0010416F94|nr:hypothetical protein [Actinomadura roseirufa]